jgi:hypothetical protein
MCLFKKKNNPVVAGLLQSVSVIVYCALISGFISLMGHYGKEPGQFWGPLIMLTLLVFSAATMGLVVFGYPVVLALNKEIKQAGYVLLWTFLFLIIFGGFLFTIAMLV